MKAGARSQRTHRRSQHSLLLALALVGVLLAALTWSLGGGASELDSLRTGAQASDGSKALAAKKVPCGKYAQGKKCQDSDGDGIPDRKDKDDDNDGIKDAKDKDDDGDGVPDKEDNCPKVPNPGQANSDGDKKGNACDKKDNKPKKN